MNEEFVGEILSLMSVVIYLSLFSHVDVMSSF